MALGLVLDGPGLTKEQYEQVTAQVAPGNKAPAGLVYHAAGLTPDGLRIVEVWESDEAMKAFFGTTLGPVLQASGIELQPSPFEVFNQIHG